jgi:uncharacterized membrane protein
VSDAAAFAGRFHPLLVHFPIALLVLAGLVELAAARRGDRSPWLLAARLPLLGLAAVAAVAAAGVGLLLGTSGGYAGATYDRHLLLGVATAIGAVVTAFAARRRARTGGGQVFVRVCLLVTLAVLTAGGHLGATLTHGEGYLTEHAPAPLRALLAALVGAPADAAPAPVGPPDQAQVYGTLVQPVLRKHCVSCHAAGAPRGRLALDTPEGIRAGGEHGAVLTGGPPLASELVRRVFLPVEHPDVMPPRGQPAIGAADAALLRWWVEHGASFDQPLAEFELAPEVRPAIEARLGPVVRGGPTLPTVTLPPLDPARLAAARALGIDVRPIADGSPWLEARLAPASGSADAAVASLVPVAGHVLWLTVAGSAVTDAACATIARLPNLTRLDVSRTAIGDAGLAALGTPAQLETLNLYGTQVTDAGLAGLAALPRLRRVYVWQTGVTEAGLGRLQAVAPKLDVVVDDAAPAPVAPPNPATRPATPD